MKAERMDKMDGVNGESPATVPVPVWLDCDPGHDVGLARWLYFCRLRVVRVLEY